MNTINKYSLNTYKLEFNNSILSIILYDGCKLVDVDYGLKMLKKRDGHDDAEFVYKIKENVFYLDRIKANGVNNLMINDVKYQGRLEGTSILYKDIAYVINKGIVVAAKNEVGKLKYPYATIFDYEEVYVIQIAAGHVVSFDNISGSVEYLRNELERAVCIENAKKIFDELPKDEVKTVEMICLPEDYFEYALM